MAGYVVTGAAAVISVKGGGERYMYRGALIGDGFTAAGIKHALDLGLLTEVPELPDLEAAAAADLEARQVAEKAAFNEAVAAAAEKLVTERAEAAKSTPASTPPVKK